jgi:transposase
MYDVKQIANILDVSKKTVYKYLKDHEKELKEYISSKKRKKVIDHKGLKVLARLSDRQDKLNSYIQKQQGSKGVTTDKEKLKENQGQDNDYIELLKDTIKDLKQDKQDLKDQVNQLQKLLDQQQQLTLLDKPKQEKEKDKDKKQTDDTTPEQEKETDPEVKKGLFSSLKNLFK